MTTPDAFERDLATAMRAYLDAAPTEIDAVGLVRRFAVAHPRRRWLLPARRAPRRLGWIALAALVVIATVAAVVLGGRPPAPVPTPSPTPDARRSLLALARGSDIYLADEESGRLMKPPGTTGLYLGAWSPDGRWLSMGTEREVMLLDVATMRLALAPLPSSAAGSSSLAVEPTVPAGPTAAPIATPAGRAPFGYGAAGWLRFGRSILLHEIGTARVFAVDIETGATFELPGLEKMCRPVLSPDARYIAGISGIGGKAVVVVDVASGASLEVSDFGGDGCVMGMGNDTPSWSPDGSQLVVVTATSLRVLNRDGSSGADIVSLDFLPTDPPARSVGPLWAPGGKWIAFHGPEGLEVIRPNGTGRRVLVTGRIDDGLYRWTPDSTRIEYGLYVGDEHPDGFSLWSVDVETGESHAIEIAQPYVDALARQPITADTPLVKLP